MTNHLRLTLIGKRICLTVLVLTLALAGRSQRWTNVGAIGLGGGAESGRGVCTDASGNVYYIGTFSGTNSDFDPGPGSTLLSAVGIQDIFITKYNSSGVFQWAVSAGGASQDMGIGIATDGTNVFIVGSFATSATFGSLGLITATGGTGTDAFVASLSAATGSFNWITRFGASGVGGDNAHGVCVDGAGGVYVSGVFNGSATIGAIPLTATGGTGGDMLIAKFSAATGAVTWAVNGGSTASGDNGLGSTICYHPGLNQLIVGGSYFGTAASYGAFNLSNSGGNDLVLLEVNAGTGAFVQAMGFGGTGGVDDDLASLCYDPVTQDIFLTGFFNGSITFTGTPTLNNTGLGDFYVARYNPVTNTFIWAVSGGSTGEERAYGICSNAAGSVYMAGYFSGSMSFGSTNLTTVTAAPEVLVGGLSVTDGAKQWALAASGNDASLADQARAISAGGPLGKIAVTGQFAGAANFGTFSFNSAGNVDIFVAQVAAAIIASTTKTDPSCENGCNGTATAIASGGVAPLSYSWTSGAAVATATNLCAGNYTVTVTDAIGQAVNADATITLPALTAASETAENTSFNISTTNTWIANAACRLIARVVPNGAFPISGPVSAFVKFEPAVPVFPPVTGQPYVQRHYQITPATGAATATARVTLYFTQAEFDAFNAHAGATLKLPLNAGDAGGKANVRIGKYPGNSSDNSGLPATYTGAAEVIDPDDAAIVFNATDNRWEISFDVDGFSGFILQTSSAPLPVTWLNVTAFLDAQQKVQLRWEVQEANVENYIVERSTDRSAYSTVATIVSQGDGEHAYNFSEAAAHTGKVYYRIKQVDKDGRSSYSHILIVDNRQGGTVTVYPNPGAGIMHLNITDRNLMNTVARLYNSDGRELQRINIRQTVTIISLGNYVKGAYFLRLSNGETLKLMKK